MSRREVSASWVFRDTEYLVSCSITEKNLEVMVEEPLTTNQWKGRFEAKRKAFDDIACGELEFVLLSVQILKSLLAKLATLNTSLSLQQCWSQPLTRYSLTHLYFWYHLG